MDRKDYAVQLKHTSCNCCQAVLCAFADEVGMTEDELKRIGAAFGVGMGCLESTCGALIGVLRQFESMCKATICKDLKGKDTGVVLCECDDCVRNAVEIMEGMLG